MTFPLAGEHLFIAFGNFVLSGIRNCSVLQVPENGIISLNVPLDDLRIGSHSTRTTHPFYFSLWNEAIEKLGMSFSVEAVRVSSSGSFVVRLTSEPDFRRGLTRACR